MSGLRTRTRSALFALTIGAASTSLSAQPVGDDESDFPSLAELEAAGTRIGNISFQIADVFDTSNPKENKSLFRLANRLHLDTRPRVIRSQLLFKTGETVSESKIRESERLLRTNPFLYDANIRPVAINGDVVDLVVVTRDLWTLTLDLSLSRSGGENRSKFGIQESNLFGYGSSFNIALDDDVDRKSLLLNYSDRNLGSSWVGLDLGYRNSDDGDARMFRLSRPFYALDARWAAGVTINEDDRVESLFSRSDVTARYRHDESRTEIVGGLSAGLVDGWTQRWSAGLVYDDNRFEAAETDEFIERVPADRKLVYPYVAYRTIENRYTTSRNLEQIDRTEDVLLGVDFGLLAGWSSTDFGADRDALIFNGHFRRGFGSPEAQFVQLAIAGGGRLESGDLRNAVISAAARYYRRQSEKRTFYAALALDAGNDLDIDNLLELGGDSGLRGYPRRFRNGESRALLSIEQRYFTDWYPLRLFRVGAALFFDAGRTWGVNAFGERNDEWLADVGFGLRLGSTRGSSSKVLHIDLAFPLSANGSIDSVQILLEGKRSL